MLDTFVSLLCSKLCRHNWHKPNHSLLSTDFEDAPGGVVLMHFLLLRHQFLTFTFKSKTCSSLHSSYDDYWNSTLKLLIVQNKFLNIVTLEQECPLWKKLMYGLFESNFLIANQL